ncbi:MAG: pyrroline-5-carboxylate reductase, partial [Pseudomonadota bacterium]|nr:pyrroline-5-carboxylate reductase [Pseudomonadota bacterium]
MARNVTFIGAGNMASAIFGGMVHSGYPADAITATATRESTLAPLADTLGIRTTTDNMAAIADADVVVLSVKPQIMRQVCETLKDGIQAKKPLIMSVAAGLSAETLEQWLGGDLPVVRCMPNTPSLVGKGASGLYANSRVTDEQRDAVSDLMSAVGIV